MSNFSIAYTLKLLTQNFESKAKLIADKMNAIDKLVQKQNRHALQFATTMSTVGKKMSLHFTTPLVAAGTAGIYAFAKMEKGLANVKGLTDDATWNKFKDKFADIQKQSILMGISLDDVNRSLFAMPSGLEVSTQAIEAYKAATKLAIAGDASLDSSTQGIVRIMSAYGDKLDNATQAASALFEGQIIGITNVQLLSENIGKVTATSRLANLSLGTMVATAAGLTKVLPTEQAVTAMNSLLSSLEKPNAEQLKAINKIGMTLGVQLPKGAAQLQKTDFINLLSKIAIVAKKRPDALMQLITDQRAIRAIGNINDELIKQIKTRADLIDKDKKYVDLNRALSDQENTTTERIKRLKGELIILSSQIGMALLPVLNKMINVINPILKYIQSLSPTTKKWIVDIAAFIAITGPFLFILGKMIKLFITLQKVIIFARVALLELSGPSIIATFSAFLPLVAAIGVAFGAWKIGTLLGQIPIVKKALLWIADHASLAERRAKAHRREVEQMVNAERALAPLAFKRAKEQGYTGAVARIVEAPKNMQEVNAMRASLEAGTFNFSKQQIGGKIIIETKDNAGVIKNIKTSVDKKPNVDVGISMLSSFYRSH